MVNDGWLVLYQIVMRRAILVLLGTCVFLYACAGAPRSAVRGPAATRPAGTQPAVRVDNPEPTTQPESPDVPVPFLTGQQAIATFNLPKGFHAELVAEEPMVQHPVAMAFDPDGRIWVCEMRGYMQDAFGAGEDKPTGRISILEDTDGDGKMDKSTVFLDGLVMPRGLGLARGGALVAAPPKLLYCRDTNGDGKCDKQEVVATDYGDGKQPEHQANGLMYGLDNWVYSVNYDKRFRDYAGVRWAAEAYAGAGQWGITQDDFGRLFFNTNSDYLRGDIVPARYVHRNPRYPGFGANVQIDADQTCWPAIPTAVNRGYRQNFLRDGRLRAFTAACAPTIYRGGLFPKEFDGNAFVCEPSANLIRRSILTESPDLSITARNAYDQAEFLASTYERFRPVNLTVGPDGALYVVDMHHGLLQHKAYLTPYARDKYLKRQLDKYLMTGRIYRIVPEGFNPPRTPRLSEASSSALVDALAHPNGWWRDTAQRLLVERNDSAALPKLKELVKSGPTPQARIQALWTVDGMRRLDPATVKVALADSDGRVRAMAIRAAEPLLASPRRSEILPDILKLAGDAEPHVRLQFALSVSEVATPEADGALARLLHDSGDNRFIRDGAVTGLRGRELEFLHRLLAEGSWRDPGAPVGARLVSPSAPRKEKRETSLAPIDATAPGRAQVLTALARAVTAERNPQRVGQLLDLIAAQNGSLSWRQKPLLGGIAAYATARPTRRPITLPAEPRALAALRKSKDAELLNKLSAAANILVWSGKPGYTPPPPPVPLTSRQQEIFAAGEKVYASVCVQCHKPDGMGQAGLAPPLVGSEWVLGPHERPVRIVLSGLRGPIDVEGDRFNLDMPSLAALTDEQIAGALTYVRRSWENDAPPVDVETVTRIRTETHGRTESWTARELLRLPVARASSATQPTSPPPEGTGRRRRPVAAGSPSPTPRSSAPPAPARSGGS
jgi:mono/diheme cytochrome c family protein/glucose/arabinose dehydrogenase